MEENNITCKNCETEMPQKSLYCPECSQKNTDGRVPISIFIKDLFFNIFNLDSKVVKTAIGLFIPARLTLAFFKGKHQSFAKPSRLFFVSALFFFTMLGFLMKNGGLHVNSAFLLESNQQLEKKTALLDGLSDLRKEAPNAEVVLIDSMIVKIETELDEMTFDISLVNDSLDIKAADFYQLSADSMIQKYQIDGFANQLFVKQTYKSFKDPGSFALTFVGNFIWVMLFLMIAMTLILKLFYARRNVYMVEHLVFLFHVHAFIFLVFGFAIVGLFLFSENLSFLPSIINVLIVLPILYVVIAMKRMYKQGWFKTILKFMLFVLGYVITFALSAVLVAVVSFMLV